MTNNSVLNEYGLEIYESKIYDIFNHTENAVNELKAFADDTINLLIKNEDFMKAFMLTAYIFNKPNTFKAKHSFGFYSFIDSLCCQQWVRLLDIIQDKRLEDEMLKWFRNCYEKKYTMMQELDKL